jgi:hypothetical protein
MYATYGNHQHQTYQCLTSVADYLSLSASHILFNISLESIQDDLCHHLPWEARII